VFFFPNETGGKARPQLKKQKRKISLNHTAKGKEVGEETGEIMPLSYVVSKLLPLPSTD